MILYTDSELVSSCEHGNETFDSVKDGTFLDHLRNS